MKSRYFSRKKSTTKNEQDLAENENEVDSYSGVQITSRMNRLIFCLFSISLLWLTSLGVSVYITQFYIEDPSFSFIYNTCNYAFEMVQEEKQAFSSCVERQTTTMNNVLNQKIIENENNIDLLAAFNLNITKNMDLLASNCSETATNAAKVLNLWISLSPQFTIPYTNSCSSIEKSQVEKKIGDPGSNRQAVYGSVQSYLAYTAGTIENLANFAVKSGDYNAQYLKNHSRFIINETELALRLIAGGLVDGIVLPFHQFSDQLEALINCLTNGTEGCEPAISRAKSDIQFYLSELKTELSQAILNLGQYETAVQNYVSNVGDAFLNVEAFFNGINTVVTKLGLDSTKFGSWWEYQLNDFYPEAVDWPDVPGFYIPFFDFDGIWSSIADGLNSLHINISMKSVWASNFAGSWVQLLDKNIQGIDVQPKDYHPPKYVGCNGNVNDFEGEKQCNQNKSSGLLSYLNEYLADATAKGGSLTASSATFVSEGKQDFGFIPSLQFSFESLVPGQFMLTQWFDLFGYFGVSFLFADVFLRVLMSLRKCRNYWHRSSTHIKPADLQVDKLSESIENMGFLGTIIQTITSHIPPVAFAVILAIMMASLLFQLYVPILTDYKAVCTDKTRVQNQKTDDFLTKNLFVLGYNFAAQDGNNQLTNSFNNFNSNRMEWCSKLAAKSQALQSNTTRNFLQANATYTSASSQVALFSTCLDVPFIEKSLDFVGCCKNPALPNCANETMYDDAMCSQKHNELELIESYGSFQLLLSERKCSLLSNLTLRNDTFQCQSLPAFWTTCEGPNRSLLKNVTHACGCSLEWKLHVGWLHVVVSVTIYALANVSRMFLVSGLSKVLWRSLNPNIFSFKASCNRNGKIFLPQMFSKSNEHNIDRFQKKLEDELAFLLRKHENVGIIQVIFAVVINIPWICLLKNASKKLQPNF